MLKKYEATLVDENFDLAGALNREVLVLISDQAKKKHLFFKSDCSQYGLDVMNSFLNLATDATEVRVICLEEDKIRIETLLTKKKYLSVRFATYLKRGRWAFNFAQGKLKFFADDKIRVLIVDDSKTMRSLLEKIFSEDEMLEIVGTIEDPTLVESELVRLKPDVMTLDIHMPKMTGVDVLRKIMPTHPVPTVMVSSVGIQEGREVLTALQLGAVDYMQKPSFDELDAVAPVLIEKLKMAASVNLKLPKKKNPSNQLHLQSINLDRRKVICIGSSTGGTEAIRRIFRSLPKIFPPILITQHIPKLFSLAFAESLKREFGIEVFEAVDGQEVLPCQVLIAPGGLQMEVILVGTTAKVRVFDGPPVNRHKPSVDVLFQSAAKVFGKNAVGVILTGMGSDGAKGLKGMKDTGSLTLAQDQETSVVYGMPKVAKELGAVEKVLSIDEIAEAMIEGCRLRQAA